MISLSAFVVMQFAMTAHAALDDNDRIATGRLCTRCEQKYVNERVFANEPIQKYAELQDQKAPAPEAPSGTETSK